jgi:hypothetical protein
MTLPTGVAAVAENNYGRPDRALDYLKRMSKSWGYAHPGSMYEVSPDFGMMCQAWNIYSFAYPIVRQFFGIAPEAHTKTIMVRPQFPSTWTFPNLKNVVLGEGEDQIALDVVYNGQSEAEQQLLIHQEGTGLWTVGVEIPKGANVVVDDEPWEGQVNGQGIGLIKGQKILIQWTK